MDDQIDIRFVNLETKFDIMQKFHNLNGDSLGDHLTWILDLKEKQKKQEEFNANIVKRLEELEDLSGQFDIAGRLLRNDNQILRKEFEEFKKSTLIRLDQEIENRTKAFERIQELETQVEALQAFNYNTDIKLERIDDILVVHRNQSDSQRKNHANLIKVWDEKVIPLIEGTHGKQK